MALPKVDIVFRQTTSQNLKCKFCRTSVEGEDGYIKINIYSGKWYNYVEKYLIICKECFKHRTDRILVDMEKRKESYNKLVKTKILRSLK